MARYLDEIEKDRIFIGNKPTQPWYLRLMALHLINILLENVYRYGYTEYVL